MSNPLLFNPKTGTARCGWQIALFVAAFILVRLPLSPLVSLLGIEGGSTFASFLVHRVLDLISIAAASALCLRVFPKPDWKSLGFEARPGFGRDALVGIAGGLALLSVTVTVAWAVGAVGIRRTPSSLFELVVSASQGLLLFSIAATAEELAFRGFPLLAARETMSPTRAALLTSVLFSLAHAANPNVSRLAILNTLLAGVWFAAVCFKRNNLWLATGLHSGWNLATVWLWGVPVSGQANILRASLFQTQPGGPAWLSGGPYGPEGGALCTAAMIVAVVLTLQPRTRTSNETEPA